LAHGLEQMRPGVNRAEEPRRLHEEIAMKSVKSVKSAKRRSFLKKGATIAAVAAAGAMRSRAVRAQAQPPAQPAAPDQPAARTRPAPVEAVTPPTTTPGFEQWKKKANKATGLFNGRVAYGPLLFISGIGYHQAGDIKVHTQNVLDSVQKQLEAAGSSMDKVVKCNVYLNDLADYAGMNEVFRGRFGEAPPVRTTVACKGGIPGDSLVEIDVIAYI
jgi:enamine deaminase RidA (YjgF/YER057c/UK114 family)